MRSIFDGAEDAALRESGAPLPTAAEREAEIAWRADLERAQARSDRTRTRLLGALMIAVALLVAVALFMTLFR